MGIQIEMSYELNHTYLELSGDGIQCDEDYRHKMLMANVIQGTLKPQYRNINGNRNIVFDITDKENLLNYFSSRTVTRQEITNLFQAIYLVSNTLSKYLVEDGNILLKPDLIYRDIKTEQYEFVCVPVSVEEEEGKSSIKNLLAFLISHLDNNDEKLVTTIYGLYDMQEFGRIRYTTLYEATVESLREEKSILDEMISEAEKKLEVETNTKKTEVSVKRKILDEKGKRLPSRKEMAVAMIAVIGCFLIGLYFYLTLV